MVWFPAMLYCIVKVLLPHLLSFSISASSIILSLCPWTLWIKMLRVWHHAIFSTVTLRNSSVRLENMIHTAWPSLRLFSAPPQPLGGWITFHISVTQRWIQTLGISSVSSVPHFFVPALLVFRSVWWDWMKFQLFKCSRVCAAAVLCLQGGTRSCSGVCGVSVEKHLYAVKGQRGPDAVT